MALCISVGAVLVACSFQEDQRPYPHLPELTAEHTTVDVPYDTLSGSRIDIEATLTMPQRLEWLGGRLVVLNGIGDPWIQVIDIASERVVATFGTKGQGPSEFSGPTSVRQSTRADDAFWVSDAGEQNRTTLLSLVNGAQNVGVELDSVYSFRGETALLESAWLRDSVVVALGLFDDARFGVFDDRGRLVSTDGNLPGKTSVPAELRHFLYLGHFGVHPEGVRFAVARQFGDAIEIYTDEVKLDTVTSGPFGFGPIDPGSAEGQSQDVYMTAESRIGYTDVEGTAEHVVALFSGRRVGDFHREAVMSRHLHVYDWSGELCRVLVLNSDAMGVAVGGETDSIFVTSVDPSPRVVAYDLERVKPMCRAE